MMRRVLASLAILGVVVVLAGGAEEQPKPPAAKGPASDATKQQASAK